MSKYEWENGTVTLPSAEVAPLKKALREHTNTFHEQVRQEAVRLHKTAGGSRSPKVYRERILGKCPGMARQDDPVKAAAMAVIDSMVYAAERGSASIHVPTVADVNRVAPKATNRTDEFIVVNHWGSESARITFKGRKVRWDVQENNHAVDTAHEAPLARLFFARLDRMTWTRGTGGYGVGNDEYNQESEYAGGGANYTTFAYGPLGEAQKAHDAGMTVERWRSIQASAKRSTHFW